MRIAAIPVLQVEVLAVASKNVGVPMVPGWGEATLMVGEAQTEIPNIRLEIRSVYLSKLGKYDIRISAQPLSTNCSHRPCWFLSRALEAQNSKNVAYR